MEKQILAVSFTGHRFLKDYKKIEEFVEKYLRNFVNENKDKRLVFYTGAAKGFDQLIFFKINKIKKEFKYKGEEVDIQNNIASPINNFKVPNMGIMKKLADNFVEVENLEEYKTDIFKQKFQKRNEYMVDNSSILIAYYDERESGGTFNCIQYAKSKNKEIIYLKEMIDNA